MIYKEYQDLKLSALGMGAMRLPVIDGDDGIIDEVATSEMVAYAMDQGINYYDTAWGYHNGQSELVMGKVLEKYPRESYYLATKFPGYDLSNMDKIETIFEEQLQKCGVDYFDFYLFHNVCEMNIDAYLDEKYGIFDYLCMQKENGRIKHLGFSAHGSYHVMKRFLEIYGDKMEFCQIQLNYLDWTFQDSKAKIDLLEEYHIPVWVMEPLRGGRLANLSDANNAKLKELRPLEGIEVKNKSCTTPENRFEKGLAVQQSIFGESLINKMRATAPEELKHIQDYLSAYCFGDFHTRGMVDLKTRELLTFCCLATLGGCESQLKSHIVGNLNVGNDYNTLLSAITWCVPYIGFPRTLNTINCINEIIK